jgi:hypothetical protein
MLLAVVHGTSVWYALVLVDETIVAKWRCGAVVSTQRKFSSRDPDAPNGDGNRVDVLRMDTMCLRYGNRVLLDTELATHGYRTPNCPAYRYWIYLATTMFCTCLVLGYVW